MTVRFQVVPASYLIFQCRDSVLLQLRQGTGYLDGYWATAAAGHVEAGESAVQAAVREAREELGIEVSPHDVVPLTSMHRSNGGGQAVDERVDFFFLCSGWQGEPRIMEPYLSCGTTASGRSSRENHSSPAALPTLRRRRLCR